MQQRVIANTWTAALCFQKKNFNSSLHASNLKGKVVLQLYKILVLLVEDAALCTHSPLTLSPSLVYLVAIFFVLIDFISYSVCSHCVRGIN